MYTRPTTDQWVCWIVDDPGEVRHMALPLLEDIEAVLAARQHERDDPPEAAACRALIAAAVMAQIRGEARNNPGARRDARLWAKSLGLEVSTATIRQAVTRIASEPETGGGKRNFRDRRRPKRYV